MSLLYLFWLLPLIIGAVVYYFNEEVNLWEYTLGSLAALLLITGVHIYSFYSQTKDYEIWSGKVVLSKQYSAWREQYKEAVYKTVTRRSSNGSTYTTEVFSHYETRYEYHPEYFEIETNIGSTHRISKRKHLYFAKLFNNLSKIQGIRTTGKMSSKMVSGDPYDYITRAGEIVEPISETRSVTNRLKAARSVFNFAEVPEGTKVFEYPRTTNLFQSKRLVGLAKNQISIKQWDTMCAFLGTAKNVNVILVGFDSPEAMLAEWQRSHWLGGKKNDIVLCYGKGWSKVYGWSDADISKKNLESILLNHPINNDIIPLIQHEINRNYTKTNWSKFDHLTIEPTLGNWIFLVLMMLVTQLGLFFYFSTNEHSK